MKIKTDNIFFNNSKFCWKYFFLLFLEHDNRNMNCISNYAASVVDN